MIAAVGQFEMGPLVEALRAMASNANRAYDHELRAKGGGLLHDCGWGAAYLEGDRLVRVRSARSCLMDPAFDSLAGVETRLAILHARRTPHRETIDVTNSHPFLQEWRGETWAFCHNGAVDDLTQLSWDDDLRQQGSVDSEFLFHHVLTRLDMGRPAGSLAEILGGVRDFTCLNCFLATRSGVTAHARMSPDTTRPRYYTLWRGEGGDFTLASSESFDLPGTVWMAVPDGSSFTMEIQSATAAPQGKH
jgi:predicted glutamine amidotransferase